MNEYTRLRDELIKAARSDSVHYLANLRAAVTALDRFVLPRLVAEGSPPPASPRHHPSCGREKDEPRWHCHPNCPLYAAEGGDTLTPETPLETAPSVTDETLPEYLRRMACQLEELHALDAMDWLNEQADEVEAQAARIAAAFEDGRRQGYIEGKEAGCATS